MVADGSVLTSPEEWEERVVPRQQAAGPVGPCRDIVMSIGCLLHGCRTRPERKCSFQQFSQVPQLCQMKLSDKIPAPFGGACERLMEAGGNNSL